MACPESFPGQIELSAHALSGRNPKDISLNVLVASWVQLVLHNTSTAECRDLRFSGQFLLISCHCSLALAYSGSEHYNRRVRSRLPVASEDLFFHILLLANWTATW